MQAILADSGTLSVGVSFLIRFVSISIIVASRLNRLNSLWYGSVACMSCMPPSRIVFSRLRLEDSEWGFVGALELSHHFESLL